MNFREVLPFGTYWSNEKKQKTHENKRKKWHKNWISLMNHQIMKRLFREI
jgi:hypothetical protein